MTTTTTTVSPALVRSVIDAPTAAALSYAIAALECDAKEFLDSDLSSIAKRLQRDADLLRKLMQSRYGF